MVGFYLTHSIAPNNLTSNGFPVSVPCNLIREWHVAIACTRGESNGINVGSVTISFNPDFRLSTTPFKSKFASVKVPV